ncbi:MAG: crossover junction endodeoxyribonuclease RuvC [Candidatus Electryoneaceae bacterium]|nr:crossover junction endodeoxyribonuclease RuvC [Candidatus Electryoneaceae bacterium]
MKFFGIDPGLTATGYGVVERIGNRLIPIDWGVIRSGKGVLAERLERIYTGLTAKLSEHHPDIVAIEEIFTGRNPRSALLVGHARGVALLAGALGGCPVQEYAATVVKQAVVGNGRASKQQVAFMVGKLLNLQDQSLPADASDALGIAICCLFRSKV